MTFRDIRPVVNVLSKSAAIALLLAATALPAAAAIGDWTGDGNARLRLVAAGPDADGNLAAAIEIALDPGWKTYWRSPGDAGIAPIADFAGSTNIVEPVEIGFPPPHRSDDGYAVTNVYEGRVLLPLTVKLADPVAATTLTVGLDIGVCEEICVPAHFDLRLDVAPGESDGEADALIDEARAALPGKPEPGAFDVERIVRAGGTDKRPVFEIGIVAPQPETAEVFIEGPGDWYPAPPKLVGADGSRATYSVEFSRLGSKTPLGGNAFRVTVVSGGRAIEDAVTLD